MVLGAGLALLAWLIAALFQLGSAYWATASGSRQVELASAAIANLDTQAVGDHLGRASDQFESASRRARGLTLAPLRALPVLGRQVHSFADLSSTAGAVATAGTDAVQTLGAIRSSGWESGEARVSMLEQLAAAAVRANRSLEDIDLGHSLSVIAPLARRWRELETAVAQARQDLLTGATLLQGLADVLDGPRRYLVLAANNAEMRAGTGMFLSAGVLTFESGSLSLGPMRPTGDLTLPGPGVAVGGDLEDRWGWLAPGREWRNLATSSRFDAVAPVAARMWAAATGEPVDGVIAVDVELLRAALEVIGPLDTGTTQVSAEGIVDRLLHDQYLDLQSSASPDQVDRREELGRIASSVVEAMDSARYPPERLALSLATAAQGRHLLAWSSIPADQQTWVAGNVTGELSPDSLAVALLNQGGNKLDQYLSVSADLALQPSSAGTKVDLRLQLLNQTPRGAPGYIAGPHPDTDLQRGEYSGILAVSLPGHARDIQLVGAGDLVTQGPDGPTTVLASRLTLPRGSETSVEVSFFLPAGQDSLTIIPSARIPPVRWRLGDRAWLDNQTIRVAVDSGEVRQSP